MQSSEQRSILGPLGLDVVEEQVYRSLLRSPGSSLASISLDTGLGRRPVSAALKSLQAHGVITRATQGKGRYVPLAPELVVEVLLNRRRHELEQARNLSGDLSEEFQIGQKQVGTQGVISLVEGKDALHRQCHQLHEITTKEILVFNPPADSGGVYTNHQELDLLARGVSYRIIYDQPALELEGHIGTIQRHMAAGENARVYPKLPMWMMISDERLGLVPLDSSELAYGGAALIESSWLLDSLILLFERVWDRALPLNSDAGDAAQEKAKRAGLSVTDVEILTLLVAGLTDEVIARRLGVNPVTVRRRLARMIKLLGAQSRFQAGVFAARQGWV